MEKKVKFAANMHDAIVSNIFDENSEYYIGPVKDEDLNDFFYALMLTVPRLLYNKITGEDKDVLEINAL